jgi:hypothetical protein
MSATETEQGQRIENGSSVKLSTNAKGDVQIEVKVRVDSAAEVGNAQAIAELTFNSLRAKYPRTA